MNALEASIDPQNAALRAIWRAAASLATLFGARRSDFFIVLARNLFRAPNSAQPPEGSAI